MSPQILLKFKSDSIRLISLIEVDYDYRFLTIQIRYSRALQYIMFHAYRSRTKTCVSKYSIFEHYIIEFINFIDYLYACKITNDYNMNVSGRVCI